MRYLLLLFTILSAATGVLRAQGAWIPAGGAGTDPYTFWGSEFYCTAGVTCEVDVESPPGGHDQVSLAAGGTCWSGMEPNVPNGVLVLSCSNPMFLYTTGRYQSKMYWDDFGALVTADGVLTRAAAYIEWYGFLYPWWQSNKSADCFDDAIVESRPRPNPLLMDSSGETRMYSGITLVIWAVVIFVSFGWSGRSTQGVVHARTMGFRVWRGVSLSIDVLLLMFGYLAKNLNIG